MDNFDVFNAALNQVKQSNYKPNIIILNNGISGLTHKDFGLKDSDVESFDEIENGIYKIVFKSALPDHG